MTVNLENEVGPKYQRLKSHIIARIKAGDWQPAHQLPSEHELVSSLQVSRMTVNRALRELASEGYLTRVPGVGTFVAEIHSRSHFSKSIILPMKSGSANMIIPQQSF